MSDATTNTNASQMLQAFIAAGQALDELPKVKADLASAQENISVGNQIIDHMTAEARAAQDKIDSLTAALAQKEAELSDITFRHSQMQNKFRTVADALGLVSAEAVKPITAPLPTQSDHVSGPSAEASNAEQHSGQSAADPTDPTADGSTSALHPNATDMTAEHSTIANSVNPSQDQRDMDPTNPTTSPPHSESNTSPHGNSIEQPTTANPSPASAVAAPAPNPTPSASPTDISGTTNQAADTPTGSVGRSGDGDDDATRCTSWSNPHHTDHAASA